MTESEDKPVDREAWRRLLAGDGEGPPELTDARIRAKARQAITPRTGRWWLPASLAASLLLAVVLVQRQYERTGAPAVVSESEYATAPASDQAAPPDADALHASPPPPAAAAPQPQRAGDPVPANAPEVVQRRAAAQEAVADSSRLDGFVADAPVAPPPAIDLPASAETRHEEKELQEIAVSGERRREGDLEATTPVTQVTSADVAAQGATRIGGLMKSEVAARTPEQWYAEIEKLRAAGRKDEAKRELEELRKVHPGWLEKNHPTDR